MMEIALFGIVVAFVMLIRNEQVYKHRQRLIKWAYDQPKWREARRILDNPSYNRMMYAFWEPWPEVGS